jgi:hypothetical protein
METIKTSKTRLLILIFCLGLLDPALGQAVTDVEKQSAQELYDFHISRKKENNTAGWITLGGGIAMIVGGMAFNLSGGIMDNDTTNNNDGLWLSYLGGATTLVSIPLFIAAGSHKRKAQIQVKNGAVGYDTRHNYSGVAMVLSF